MKWKRECWSSLKWFLIFFLTVVQAKYIWSGHHFLSGLSTASIVWLLSIISQEYLLGFKSASFFFLYSHHHTWRRPCLYGWQLCLNWLLVDGGSPTGTLFGGRLKTKQKGKIWKISSETLVMSWGYKYVCVRWSYVCVSYSTFIYIYVCVCVCV